MLQAHLNAKLPVQMLGQMLGAVDTAVLAAGATEREHERSEAAFDVARHVEIGQLVNAF